MSLRQRLAAQLCTLLQARPVQHHTELLVQHQRSCLGNFECKFTTAFSSKAFAQASNPGNNQTCRAKCQLFHRSFASSSSKTPAASGATRSGAKKAAAGSGAASEPATAAAEASGSGARQLSPFEQWRQRWQQVPGVPKWLGLAGAIPFIALAPPVCKHLAPILPTPIAANCEMIQVCYGAVIVTFLGAVHWGVAMASPLTSPMAVRLANDAYVYSVIPSLLACPAAVMEPGFGAVVLSVLLPGCYLADYTRRHFGLPAWYMTLRAPLTVLATFGMLLTATRFVHAQMDMVKAAEQAANASAAGPTGSTG